MKKAKSPAPKAAQGSKPASLEGRCVPAGTQSKNLLSRLLGITATQGKYTLRAVAWMDHALEASIATDGDGEVTFRIERRSEDAQGLVVTDKLILYFRGEGIPEDLLEAVSEHAPEMLAEHTIESLSALIASDPELGDPALPMPPGVDEGDRPRSLLDTWGDKDAFADFFAGGELARAQLDSLDPGALFSFTQHSDCECLHVNPHGGGPVVWLTNYPWDNRIRHGSSTAERQDLTTAAIEGMITSDLNENDVIMGNPDKLQRILKHAEKVHARTGKTLFFSA